MPSKIVQTRYLSGSILLASVLGMFLVWLRQYNYGVGIDPDSIAYVDLAENLSKRRSLDATSPWFPFMLCIVISLDIVDKFSSAAYLNMIAFGLSISIFIVWLSTKIRSHFILLYAGIACALFPLLGHEYATAKTESLFTLLVVTSLLTLDMFLDSNKKRWIILAALSAALSFLTRYIGISIIISIPILVVARTRLSLRGFKCVVIHLAITVPVVGLYFLQNLLRTGGFFVQQWGWPFSNSYSIDTLTSELIKWLFSNTIFDYLEIISEKLDVNNILIRVVLLVALTTFLGYIFVRIYPRNRLPKFGVLATPIVFIIVYTLVLWFSLASGNKTGSIIPRYLAPIYMPFLIVFAVILDRIWGALCRKVYIIAIVNLMSIWLIFTTLASHSNIREWLDYGYSYSSKGWADSETIDYLRLNPVVGLIYSNEIRAVRAHGRIPNSDGVYFRQLPPDLPSMLAVGPVPRNIDIYIIWFHGWKYYKPAPLRYDFMSLVASQDLQIIAALEDGMILKDGSDTSQYSEGLRAVILESILREAQLVIDNPVFNIYLDGKRLVYISTLCDSTDIESRFFLHIYPVNSVDIIESRRIKSLDFNNYDFSFNLEGFFFGESCAVIRNLPDYDIKVIRTGQYTAEVELWEEEFRPELPYRQKIS